MKTLIIYMSSHGTTEKAVSKISYILGYNNHVIVNLKNETPPPLDKFDTVIIGGSVHGGTVQKKITKYCNDNISELLTKRLGLFMCYMNEEKKFEEFEDSYPEILREHAIAKGYFGGEFKLEKMNFIEKLVVRKVSGVEESISNLNYQAINQFAIMITG